MSAPKAGFRCIFAFDAFFNARNVKLDFKDDGAPVELLVNGISTA